MARPCISTCFTRPKTTSDRAGRCITPILRLVSLPFFLEEVLGRSAVETGLLMTPWPVAVDFTALIAGWLVDRHYPAGILGEIGLAVLSLGPVLVASQEAHAAVSPIAWWMAICGVGFGFFQSPNNRTILASAPREHAGSASGILASARLVGQTLGAALVGLIFTLTGARPGGIGHGAARRGRLRRGRCVGERPASAALSSLFRGLRLRASCTISCCNGPSDFSSRPVAPSTYL